MTENFKEIKDKNSIKDNCDFKGIVKLYDENGNLLMTTHNLIVFSGRKIIMDAFRKLLNLGDTSTITEGNSLYFNFGYTGNSIITSSDLTYKDVKPSNSDSGFFYQVNVSDSSLPLTITEESNELCLSFTITITGSETFQKFDEIFLSYGTNDSDQTLFSRVAMDPVFLGVNDTYSLKYSIYF